MNVELASLGDPLYMSPPTAWNPPWSALLTCPEIAADPAWRTATSGVWVHHLPSGVIPADQGWKIHVSCLVGNAATALTRAAEVCANYGVPFKHLSSTALVAAMASRRAPRSAAGKAIAVYPEDERTAVALAEDLASSLRGLEGPYVLTDMRWRPDAPVFLRYGSYVAHRTYRPDGRRVHARRLPSGGWTEDPRSIPFSLPEDVTPGPELARVLTRPRLGVSFPVRITSAIQHTACGGVYRGTHVSTGRATVVKEAIPLTGGNPAMSDATTRMRNESAALRRLEAAHGADPEGPVTPRHLETFTVDGHLFIAVEDVPGTPLRQWASQNHPAIRAGTTSSDFSAYAHAAALLVANLRRAIDRLHAVGLAHNDVHPGNILVDDHLGVRLVDLELADDVDSLAVPPLRCGGFSTAQGTARERDLLGVDMIAAWLLHPAIGGGLELAPDLLGTYAREATSWFGPASAPVVDALAHYGDRGARVTHTRATPVRAARSADGSLDPARLAAHVRWTAEAEATTLLPGDSATYGSALSLAALEHGSAGVLLAAAASGLEIPASWRGHVARVADRARGAAAAPGLWDGWAGLALTWHELGDEDRARDALAEADAAADGCTDPSLATGRAGLALAHLHLRGDAAAARVDELLAGLAGDRGTWIPRCRVAGLLEGPSGVAAVLASAGRPEWLEAALGWIEADLAETSPGVGGDLLLRSDRRLLPYLGDGSLGLALARGHVLRALGESGDDEVQRCLALSADVRTCVEGGLRYGRAGLALGLHLLADREEDADHATWLRTTALRHDRSLAAYALDIDEGTTILGRGSVRASGDLATGAAGVLAALTAPARPLLATLCGAPAAERPRTRDSAQLPDHLPTHVFRRR